MMLCYSRLRLLWASVGVFACVLLSGCPAPSPETVPEAKQGAVPESRLPPVQTSDELPRPETPDRSQPAASAITTAGLYQDAPVGSTQLVNALPGSGIQFRHTDGGGEKQYIVQTVVAGLALLDYDLDGWVDIYFLNGSEVPGNPLPSVPTNSLYRNNGDWTFTDVSDAAGVADTGYGLGVAAADYDNDGDQDLYVNNLGPNVLYRNNGDGTFTDVTSDAGVQCDKMGAGVSFTDTDADGDLDLYVANYVDFQYDNYISRKVGKLEYAAAPSDYPAESDVLFRNNGDGTFTDVSRSSGIDSLASTSMGIISLDYDNDRDADVMVCCDNAANQLLRNDGEGNFEEIGVLAGVAHDLRGSDNGSMGVDAGDFDNDGRLDLFVTNYQGELSVLYRNVEGGFFNDVTRLTGAGVSSYPHVKWGTSLVDFDLDGDRDLYVACGHFIEHIEHLDDRTAVRVPNYLYENLGNGRFEDVSQRSGEAMGIALSSKGAGFDDLDNDGDIDVVVLNANSKPTLLRNETVTERRGLLLNLVGHPSNRDGVGARVTVVSGQQRQVAEVFSGRGYQSHYGMRPHFGIEDEAVIDRIEIDWLGGGSDVYENPPPARVLQLQQGGSHHVLIPSRDAGNDTT